MLIFVSFQRIGGVLGENGDPALALERIRIHHALCDDLIFAERAGLAKHLVDQRRLAVIDVRDDGDITNLHSLEIYPAEWNAKQARDVAADTARVIST